MMVALQEVKKVNQLRRGKRGEGLDLKRYNNSKQENKRGGGVNFMPTMERK